MLICEVVGGNKYQRELAHGVVQHCVHALIPDIDSIDIRVKIADLQRHWGDDLYAYCEESDKQEYQIHVERTLDPETFIRYLCHEMVHVMQYTQGTLREVHGSSVPGTVIWMGQEHCEKDYAYADLPWELQAFELQEVLSEKFLANLRIQSNDSIEFRYLYSILTEWRSKDNYENT